MRGMKAHWQHEKQLIQQLREIKEQQEQLGTEAEQAQRARSPARWVCPWAAKKFMGSSKAELKCLRLVLRVFVL